MVTETPVQPQVDDTGIDLDEKTLLEMYWQMVRARRTDERTWVLHRQGKIAFHISGIGQEGIQVGAAYALRHGYDYVHLYYRDLAFAFGIRSRAFSIICGTRVCWTTARLRRWNSASGRK